MNHLAVALTYITITCCSLQPQETLPITIFETVGMSESWLDGMKDFTEKIQTNEPVKGEMQKVDDLIDEHTDLDLTVDWTPIQKFNRYVREFFDKLFSIFN